MPKAKSSKKLKLEECFLHSVASPVDLARRLLIDLPDLERLANADHRFKQWTTKKGRKIQEPVRELQVVHGRVMRLLSAVEPPLYLYSAVAGRSYITNARQHVGAYPTVKLDLQKFFPSVKRAAIRNFFVREMKCAGDVASILAKILTCNGALPTGSRASSIMSFYAFKSMFDELGDLAIANNCTMTVYVDDIAISGEGARPRLLVKARRIIARYGLKSHKTKFFQALQARIITGVVVDPAGIALPHSRRVQIERGLAVLAAECDPKWKLEILTRLVSRVYEAAQIAPAEFLALATELSKARAELLKKASELAVASVAPDRRSHLRLVHSDASTSDRVASP
ncbi:reverse transcriptase family protein [Variibacter gotjawalensis]|nr:reverse transcriptase family protein [Variibacter gotjawalensis]NIK47833.1 hypothetical protein [Variibacter gotjawalensis]